jgi:hypothetical protein
MLMTVWEQWRGVRVEEVVCQNTVDAEIVSTYTTGECPSGAQINP